MKLSQAQKLNILAIDLLEALGNTLPTEAEIEYVEGLIHNVRAHLTHRPFPRHADAVMHNGVN